MLMSATQAKKEHESQPEQHKNTVKNPAPFPGISEYLWK